MRKHCSLWLFAGMKLILGGADLDSVTMAVSRSSLEEKLKSLKEVDIAPNDILWSGRMCTATSSFGELWIGKWQGQHVALKKVKCNCKIKCGCRDATAESRLRKEARMMMKLASAHIVPVHGFVSQPPAIVMQLMRCSLGSLLRSSRGQLPWITKVRMMITKHHMARISHLSDSHHLANRQWITVHSQSRCVASRS
jgi:hypothetical protein